VKGRKHLSESGNSYSQKSAGLDPRSGSSVFGVCTTVLIDGLVVSSIQKNTRGQISTR
jgi:hypothetical protein